MCKLLSSFMALLLICFSASSFAIPVRHHFVGEIEQSSFGYEGKSFTGWYEYDYGTYQGETEELGIIHGLFSYYLKVGDLELSSGGTSGIESHVTYFDNAVRGLSVKSESPTELSGANYGLDVFEFGIYDADSNGVAEEFTPGEIAPDMSNLSIGSFEIYGHTNATLPDQSEGVFLLKGAFQQVDVTHTVPEPSISLMFAMGLAFMFGLRKKLNKV